MAIDDLKAAFARRHETARILFDQNLIARHAAAEQALQDALSNDDDSIGDSPSVHRARVAVEAAEAEVAEAEVEFEFAGIGRQAWLRMVAVHPPLAEHKAEGFDFNPETFPPAALAASCVSRPLTLEDAEWLAAELDIAEWSKLWGACITANVGVATRPKSVAATVLRRTSAPSWTTARQGASPDRSS